MYCKEFNIPSYPGTYGDQPKKWVDKSFIIKNAFDVKRYNEQKRASKQGS